MFHKATRQISFGPRNMRLEAAGLLRNLDKFYPHDCDRSCVTHLRFNLKQLDSFLVPFYYGFYRVALKHKDTIDLVYVTPCRKVLASLLHVQRYLQVTELDLDIDHFTLSVNFEVRRLKTNVLAYNADISNGAESRAVSFVNSLEQKGFDFTFTYAPFPHLHPKINIDEIYLENFVVSCECEDDCSSSINSCACRYLTYIENCKQTSGYTYKRLHVQNVFGVFECNNRCKCSSKCFNRVLQNGMKCHLQVFATLNKGWAVRALHFIPKGAFISEYTGQIITDEQANKVEVDDFLASLDHIEGTLFYEKAGQANLTRMQMFGQESPYVVDGFRYSNIGRLFSHSCTPNIFPQTVFVDTHDLRFCRIGFFAARDISPFEELHWDYNYSDESKFVCYCHSNQCRRLI